jgi:hypothetical protein
MRVMLAAAGLVVLAALVLWGVDLGRIARTRGWLRAVLAAALAVLPLGGCQDQPAPAPVQPSRPETKRVTCYKSAPVPDLPARAAIARLSQRVPLLERLAAEGTLRPDVVCKALRDAEEDLARIASQTLDRAVKLTAPERALAARLRKRLERQQAALRSTCSGH